MRKCLKPIMLGALLGAAFILAGCGGNRPPVNSRIIDHQCARLTWLQRIPTDAIAGAKANLHIIYGHTSHGSQITEGMTGLVAFEGAAYAWNNGGTGGALDLREGDGYGSGDMDHDAGYYPGWVNETRAYLGTPDTAGRGQNHPEINVVIWSWCGQVSGYAAQTMIDQYLSPMNQLELDYPGVTFVYMTGHLDGTGLQGNLHQRNQQIRDYCLANDKWLYDFEDIESYDPGGVYYGDKHPTDAGCYDYNNDGVTTVSSTDPTVPANGDRNWARDWQERHKVNVGWYECGSQHTLPANANMKAYAAWWLWARLAGWNGTIS